MIAEVHNELEGQVALREMLVKERIAKLEKEFGSRLAEKEIVKNKEIARLKDEFMTKSSELDLKLTELTIRDKAQMAMVKKLNEVKTQSELELKTWKEHACDLNSKLDSLKQKLKDCRDLCGKNFEKKVAEMRETFSLQEYRMKMDINDHKAENAQLREEKEKAQQVISNLESEKELLEKTICDVEVRETESKEEMVRLKRELDVLRKSKEDDDRAMIDMAGHHNTRQKLSYLDKLRKENYDLNLKVKALEAQVYKLTKPTSGPTGPLTRNRSNRGGKTLLAEP
uniref:Myosin_tail_1 domain-containing protein n=1 Tax=Heterorhabditis bacteriophora TaxID=37862 RepID=A0A1I7XTF5_HETBA